MAATTSLLLLSKHLSMWMLMFASGISTWQIGQVTIATTFFAIPLETAVFVGVNAGGLLIMLNRLLTLISGLDWLVVLGEPAGDRSSPELLRGVLKGDASNELLGSLRGDSMRISHSDVCALASCNGGFELIGFKGEEAAFCGFGLSCLTADWTPCSFCDKGPRRRRMTTIISSRVRLFFSSISLTTVKHCGQDVLYCMNFLMQTEQTRKLER